jgi:biotin carboxyl carrier protein
MTGQTSSQSQRTKPVNRHTAKIEEASVKETELDYGGKKVRCKSLVIDGTKYRTTYNRKFENRKKWDSPDPRKIVSFIPGTVVKVYVKEGQEVKPGDNMLILEAMKMKNKVVFHREATVKSIRVKEGEKIPKNHVMIELE